MNTPSRKQFIELITHFKLATEATKEEEIEYYGLCLFGKTEILREFTGKFSLFK